MRVDTYRKKSSVQTSLGACVRDLRHTVNVYDKMYILCKMCLFKASIAKAKHGMCKIVYDNLKSELSSHIFISSYIKAYKVKNYRPLELGDAYIKVCAHEDEIRAYLENELNKERNYDS